MSLCIPPNWDQTVSPRCAKNLPSILVTNFFSLSNTETAKHSIFKWKKKKRKFLLQRKTTHNSSSTHVSLHVCFGSHQSLAQPFAGAAALEAPVISAGNSAQGPSPHQARLEKKDSLISTAHFLILSNWCALGAPFQLLQCKTTLEGRSKAGLSTCRSTWTPSRLDWLGFCSLELKQGERCVSHSSTAHLSEPDRTQPSGRVTSTLFFPLVRLSLASADNFLIF